MDTNLIKQVEERTQGRYAPSPAHFYPTLQYLEDLGLVTSDQADGRRVYQITDPGHKELDERNSVVEGFWSRFKESRPRGAARHEISFMLEALNGLNRTVSQGIHATMSTGDVDMIRGMRAAIERCQNEIRNIIAGATAGQAVSDEGSEVDNHGDIDPHTLTDEDLL